MPAVAGNAAGYAIFNSGTTYVFDTDPTFANGSVIGIAFDAPNRKLWFRHNGTWLKGDPATPSTGCAMTGMPADVWPYAFLRPTTSTDGVLTLNVGTTSFAGSLPTDFSAWGPT